ncbi:MAG: IS200/IS605 family transposase [Acidobacteriota bacterium]
MPSTHLSLHYHIVFSTKERYPCIERDFRDDLHRHLGGCVKTLDGIAEQIGGPADHVHLLLGLGATHCLAEVLREVKKVSSRWVHEHARISKFAWQEGYGAFTVSAHDIEPVREYIRTQEEHHRKRTFQEEYRDFLVKNGVEYDERYLW